MKPRRRRATIIVSALLILSLIGVPLWIVDRAFLREKATHELAVAVYKNDVRDALVALRAGADANTRQRPTDNPPTLAQFVRHFLRQLRGEKPMEQSDSEHRPPMIAIAAAKENTTLARALLDAHAKPDAHSEYSEDEWGDWGDDDQTNGQTALMLATEHGRVGMVEALLAKGADPNLYKVNYGNPPLFLTVNPAIIKMLLEYGANVHAQKWHGKYGGETLVALNWYYPENLKLLLAHGADINAGGEYRHALSLAAQHGEPTHVRFLLARGANPNLCDVQYYGEDSINWDALACAIEDGRTENIRLLLAHGMNPNKRDQAGRTPLFQAVEHGEDGPVQTLIEAGAKVNVRDKNGKTPLQLAEDDGNDSVEAILRKAGAKR